MDPLKLLSIIRDLSLILASLIGGIWALYKFIKTRTVMSKLEIDFLEKIHSIKDLKIVDLTIKLKNVGQVAIYEKNPRGKDFRVDVKKIPLELRNSEILFCDKRLEHLFPSIDYLKDYDEEGIDENAQINDGDLFVIEPGVTETINVAFSSSYLGLIYVQVSFTDKEDYYFATKKIIDMS